jgi:excisionase family DNA binding protein
MAHGNDKRRAAQAARHREAMETVVAERPEAPRVTITIPEAARRLSIGRNQGYEAARRGDIPTIRVGKRYLVPLPAFELMLRGE